MENIQPQAEECNKIPTTQQQNSAAFTESVPDGNIPGRSGEDQETPLHEADKCNAKIHYLSRTMARQHGVIPATVLAGFAYKLKYHRKNQWKDRWWYYESIEVLRTHRWPYLSDGCICENAEYLCGKNLLIKDCNNKLSFDHTTWYAMEDDIREAALSDLVWFDVPVTRKLGSIHAGLIFHNLRFHLREIVKNDPECQVPYHKLSVTRLARDLPMSASTAKRWVKELVKQGLIIRHPTKRNLSTLAPQAEYLQIGSTTNAIGSSANAIRSSTNGSTANAIGSSTNAIRSSANAIGSTANDNTQYETNLKPVGNQSQMPVCVSLNQSSSFVRTNNGGNQSGIVNFFDYAPIPDSNLLSDRDGHKDDKIISDAVVSTNEESRHESDSNHHTMIRDSVGSAPPGGKENTATSPQTAFSTLVDVTKLKTFDQLIHQTAVSLQLLHSLDDNTKDKVGKLLVGACPHFVEHHLPATTIQELWDTTKRDQLVQALRQPLADYVATQMSRRSNLSLSEDQLWQLFYYPQLETLVRSFTKDKVVQAYDGHTMPSQLAEVRSTYWALVQKLCDEVKFSAEFKCNLFKQAISMYNHYGWEQLDGSQHKNAVQATSSGFKKIKTIFMENPSVSTNQLCSVLGECVSISLRNNVPDGFDKYWAARRGRNLDEFARHIEKIIMELDMISNCPIGAVA